MRSIRAYFFSPIADGKGLPRSRFDQFLAMVLALALMAAMAYSTEPAGWTEERALLVTVAIVLVTVGTRHRTYVFGAAMGFVTFRALIGVFFGLSGAYTARQTTILFLVTVMCAAITWFLLKDV